MCRLTAAHVNKTLNSQRCRAQSRSGADRADCAPCWLGGRARPHRSHRATVSRQVSRLRQFLLIKRLFVFIRMLHLAAALRLIVQVGIAECSCEPPGNWDIFSFFFFSAFSLKSWILSCEATGRSSGLLLLRLKLFGCWQLVPASKRLGRRQSLRFDPQPMERRRWAPVLRGEELFYIPPDGSNAKFGATKSSQEKTKQTYSRISEHRPTHSGLTGLCEDQPSNSGGF